MVTDILYLIERMIGYMAFLEVKNLTRIYGKKENQLTALDHVSFSVERGEFVAVTGASGSGKSTLLHLLGTMDDAQDGSVKLEGEDVLGMKEKQMDREYLAKLLKILGLEERKYHLPEELSGGQKQRVAIARALANHPSLLLADEPPGNLDHQNGLEVMSLLKNAVEQFSLTLIVVTHDPGIASMADRVITLSDGVIISDAKVKHALSSEIVRNETEGMSQTAPDQEEV